MTQVNIFQAKTELSKLIASLEKKENDRIIIARDGTPVAVLQLYQPEKKSIELGKFDGKYEIPADIDAGNDEILMLMEGDL